ncbi:MAG: hypothetical protein ACXVXC_04325 [Nocardioidaceae bacterium]
MTPLQKIAMGIVIVALNATVNGYDLLPDPLGWLLAMSGVLALRARIPAGDTLTGVGGLAGLVSVVVYPPQVLQQFPSSVDWLFSVPEVVFLILLCGGLGALAAEAGDATAPRFRALRWVFVALLALPVLVYGGRIAVLLPPAALLAVGSVVYVVFLLFQVSRRGWALAAAPSPRPGP